MYKNDFQVEIYARSQDSNSIDRNDFITINEEYKSKDNHFIIGKIKFSKLTQSEWIQKPHVNVLISTESKIENVE